MEIITWIGIIICLIQSAIFSGSNLALFSLSRLRLEAEVEKGNQRAVRILNLRQDSNLLLCTILWGNVSVNVLLALLVDSVLAGFAGFAFSTGGITFLGEILPQAYFSRHAIKVGSILSPLLRFYQILLYPLAKPCAFILDGWIGKEGLTLYRERDLEIILEKHIEESASEISANEGKGALNFLALDDRIISAEGSTIDPNTIYTFPVQLDLPILPQPDTEAGQSFIDSLKKHPYLWTTIISETGTPLLVINTTDYLSSLYAYGKSVSILDSCHRPILVTDPDLTLDTVLGELVVEATDSNDNIVDRDVIIYWSSDNKRIITGADIFGRLLKGIAKKEYA